MSLDSKRKKKADKVVMSIEEGQDRKGKRQQESWQDQGNPSLEKGDAKNADDGKRKSGRLPIEGKETGGERDAILTSGTQGKRQE